MQERINDINILLIVVTALIITMVLFIISIVYLYRKRQKTFGESIQALTLMHEKEILDTRLEIQEQTFQHISREIHDNINLSLTLAKLNLNTIDDNNYKEQSAIKIQSSISLLTKSIGELSDISKALNADLIIQQGLVEAIVNEINRIEQAGEIKINFSVEGEPVFFQAKNELIIFRIIQEAFNNIIKHANATCSWLVLNFNGSELKFSVTDNGKGFNIETSLSKTNAGLRNMQNRAKMIGGTMEIQSEKGKGTKLLFNIPYLKDEQ